MIIWNLQHLYCLKQWGRSCCWAFCSTEHTRQAEKNYILSSKTCMVPIYLKQSIKLLVISSEMVSYGKLEIKSRGRSRGPKHKASWRVYCLLLKTAALEGHPCPDKIFPNFWPIHILLSCYWSLMFSYFPSQRRCPTFQELLKNLQIDLIIPFPEFKTITSFLVSLCTSYFQGFWKGWSLVTS